MSDKSKIDIPDDATVKVSNQKKPPEFDLTKAAEATSRFGRFTEALRNAVTAVKELPTRFRGQNGVAFDQAVIGEPTPTKERTSASVAPARSQNNNPSKDRTVIGKDYADIDPQSAKLFKQNVARSNASSSTNEKADYEPEVRNDEFEYQIKLLRAGKFNGRRSYLAKIPEGVEPPEKLPTRALNTPTPRSDINNQAVTNNSQNKLPEKEIEENKFANIKAWNNKDGPAVPGYISFRPQPAVPNEISFRPQPALPSEISFTPKSNRLSESPSAQLNQPVNTQSQSIAANQSNTAKRQIVAEGNVEPSTNLVNKVNSPSVKTGAVSSTIVLDQTVIGDPTSPKTKQSRPTLEDRSRNFTSDRVSL